MTRSALWTRWLPAMFTLLLGAGPALAQTLGDGPGKADDSKGWIALALAIVLTLAVGMVSFLSPRRSHQDSSS